MAVRSDLASLVAIAAAVFGVDQLTKAAVIAAIGPSRPESRFATGLDWVSLEYTENTGAAFGLLAGFGPILAVVSIGIVAALLFWYRQTVRPPVWQTVGAGAIIGGALGNVFDRLRWGHVIDFVSIGPWPNFNVADSAVTIGVLLLTWGWLRSDEHEAGRMTPAEEHAWTKPELK